MALVTTSYRPKRAPREKRKQPPIANRIVTPAKLKPLKGPVIRLGRTTRPTTETRSAIVGPKRKQTSVFGSAPDMAAEEHQRRGDAADALFREIVRRVRNEGTT